VAQIGDYRYTNRALSLSSTTYTPARYLPSLLLALSCSFLWVFGSPWTPLPLAMLSLPSISCLNFCRRLISANHSGSRVSLISMTMAIHCSLEGIMTMTHAHSLSRATFVNASVAGKNVGLTASTASRVFCYRRGTSIFFDQDSREIWRMSCPVRIASASFVHCFGWSLRRLRSWLIYSLSGVILRSHDRYNFALSFVSAVSCWC
jgi:hypothetical protein